MSHPTRNTLSLKALEVLEAVAHGGSLQYAADSVGLSISSVSHHLGRLEAHIGAPLIDRSTRPMRLTPAGETYLGEVRLGLSHIRLAADKLRLEAAGAGVLRIAVVDDFEATLTPGLTLRLEAAMPKVRLILRTEPSDSAVDLLDRGRIDHALTAATAPGSPGVRLLNDPFVLATPQGGALPAEAYLTGASGLPFLRFSARHLLGQQIEAHLARTGVVLENRHEIDSNAAIMALIARGRGFAITTPVGYLRDRRFWPDVRLTPLPGASFSRTLRLMSRNDGSAATAVIADIVRTLMTTEVIAPVVQRHPWLKGALHLHKD